MKLSEFIRWILKLTTSNNRTQEKNCSNAVSARSYWNSSNPIQHALCIAQLSNSVAPKPEGSSPHSQQPATGPYPQPNESTPPSRQSPKEGDHLEDQGVGGKMGSEWVLGRLAWGVGWIGFDWLRTGTGGGLLWVRWWTFGFLRHGVSLFFFWLYSHVWTLASLIILPQIFLSSAFFHHAPIFNVFTYFQTLSSHLHLGLPSFPEPSGWENI
jgi:hypothetical protein